MVFLNLLAVLSMVVDSQGRDPFDGEIDPDPGSEGRVGRANGLKVSTRRRFANHPDSPRAEATVETGRLKTHGRRAASTH
jgi:hypothetical protein